MIEFTMPSVTTIDVVTASGTVYTFSATGNRKNRVYLETTSTMQVQTHKSGVETSLAGKVWLVLGARIDEDGKMSFTIMSYPEGWAITYVDPPNEKHSTFTTSVVKNREEAHAFFKSLI